MLIDLVQQNKGCELGSPSGGAGTALAVPEGVPNRKNVTPTVSPFGLPPPPEGVARDTAALPDNCKISVLSDDEVKLWVN